MKVALFYLAACAPGGYPRDVRWLAGALAELGVDVTLMSHGGPERDGLSDVSVEVEPARWGAVAEAADVMHGFGISHGPQIRATLGFARRTRSVVSPLAHLMHEHVRVKAWKKRPTYWAVGRMLERRGVVAHFYSTTEKQESEKYLDTKRSFVANAGVFPADERSSPTEVGDYLLFFGRNDIHQKGIDLLIDGYERAVQGGLELPLVIAGRSHGASEAFLAAAASRPSLKGRLELRGDTSDIQRAELMRKARSFVFLSRWDGPPRPIREAIALGVPVIVSTGTNLGALVEQHHAGVHVDGSSEQVGAALLRASDADEVAAWRAGAIALGAALSWDLVAADYKAGYELALT